MIVASGVIRGWAPMARARRQRSLSSPYITKVRSNPPSRCQRSRRMRKKLPCTTSTSRGVERSQPPISSGLKRLLRGSATARPLARQKRPQRVRSPKALIRFSVMSALSVRPPQMPARGFGVGEGDQPVDGAVEHHGVGVEQQEVVAARLQRPPRCCPWRSRGCRGSRSGGSRGRPRRWRRPSRPASCCPPRSPRAAPWSRPRASAGSRASSRGCCS